MMSDNVQPPKAERSLGELLGELMREVTTLIRQEMTLAKTEMSQKVSRVSKDLISLAAGGAVAYIGLLTLVGALVALLHEVVNLPVWVSALLVGLVVVGIGGFLVKKGLDALKQEDLTPRQTLETLKEDAKWAKDQTS